MIGIPLLCLLIWGVVKNFKPCVRKRGEEEAAREQAAIGNQENGIGGGSTLWATGHKEVGVSYV